MDAAKALVALGVAITISKYVHPRVHNGRKARYKPQRRFRKVLASNDDNPFRHHHAACFCSSFTAIHTNTATALATVEEPDNSEPSGVDCIATNCTAGHCTASNCTAVDCTAGNSTASNCTAAIRTAGNSTASNSTASNCTAANCTAGNSTASNSTASNCTAGNCTAEQPTSSATATTALVAAVEVRETTIAATVVAAEAAPATAATAESQVHPYGLLIKDLFMQQPVHSLVRFEEPVMPSPQDSKPVHFVETRAQLQALVDKLQKVTRVAVDVEHNASHSYLGMTCLLQLSAEGDDYIVDALRLHDDLDLFHPVFANPSIMKVVHGGGNDVLWLQRDFHLYLVNVFDTEKACRVLKKEQNNLGALLKKYCEVVPDKSQQTADWRVRPLPEELVRYARSDVHYLLYLADCLWRELLVASAVEADHSLTDLNPQSPVAVALRKSQEVSLGLYHKLSHHAAATATASHLFRRFLTRQTTDAGAAGGAGAPGHHATGLQGLSAKPKTEAVRDSVFALCSWRDEQARKEDEGVHFILPDAALMDLAESAPLNRKQLLRIVEQHVTALNHVLEAQPLAAKYQLSLPVKRHAQDLCSLLRRAYSGELPWLGYVDGPSHRDAKTQQQLKQKRLQTVIKKFSAKSEVYDNCRMLSMDGELLCFCDRNKLRWYLSKELAEHVSDDPPTIRLLFQHKNTDQVSGISGFYQHSKANRCVGCGEESNYRRYRVVPSCYRRHFPPQMKSHRSHDVVLVCTHCHMLANKVAEQLKRNIAAEFGIPLFPPRAVLETNSNQQQQQQQQEQQQQQQLAGDANSEKPSSWDNTLLGPSDNGNGLQPPQRSVSVGSCGSENGASDDDNNSGLIVGSCLANGADLQQLQQSGVSQVISKEEAKQQGISNGDARDESVAYDDSRNARVADNESRDAPLANDDVRNNLVKDGRDDNESSRRDSAELLHIPPMETDDEEGEVPGQSESSMRPVEVYGYGQGKGTKGVALFKVRQAALALQRAGDALPLERRRVLEELIIRYVGRQPGAGPYGLLPGELERGLLAGLSERKRRQFWKQHKYLLQSQDHDQDQTTEGGLVPAAAPAMPEPDWVIAEKHSQGGHMRHGQELVELLLNSGDEEALVKLVQRFRQGFMDAVTPQFLPPSWDVAHNAMRDFGEYSIYHLQAGQMPSGQIELIAGSGSISLA